MGFQDRRYHENGPDDRGFFAPFKRAMRRIFVEGDNFYGWSVPFFRFKGIDVRIHIIYLVIIAARLIWPLRRDAIGFAFEAFGMTSLFVLVLLHEFGHCFACRFVRGEADRILMWPLGGLAFCRPPHHWKPALITTLGGPAVNLILIPILGGIVFGLSQDWHTVIYNPFDVQSVWNAEWFAHDTSYWRYFLWSAYHMNLALLLFNMCLPMFPLDCGRMLQELLWARVGYKKSMTIAVNIGLVMAIGIGVFALITGDSAKILFAVCIFCGINCFVTRRQLSMLEDDSPYSQNEFEGLTHAGGRGGVGEMLRGDMAPSREDKRSFKEAARKQAEQQAMQAELDRILAKIADKGMASLTRKEKATLQKVTERQRSGKL